MNPERLMTKSIRTSSHGDRVVRIMAAGLDAVDPSKAVERYMQREDDRIMIGHQVYDLDSFDRVLLVGFGKASIPMGDTASQILEDILWEGIIISKTILTRNNPRLPVFEGSHPIPSQRSIDGTQKMVDLLSTTTENDLVICLISGGGSALLTLPSEGISLDDLQALTKLLLECGATINEINCLRKHISQVKGGQLARIAAPARIATLILSDVVGDPLDVIASGPTVPDPTSYANALGILMKFGIEAQTPDSILDHLKFGMLGEIQETPKAGDPIFAQTQNVIIGNNYLAAKAAIEQAKAEGFNTLLLTTSLQGEARVAGQMMASVIKQVVISGDPIPRPACIIAGGETTVTIQGDGRGGRNQELALAAVSDLADLPEVMLISLATDGEDGPTNAAGAVVTGDTLQQARIMNQNPLEYLSRNDAYHFFDPLGDLLKPNATQTNVNDLTFLLIY
jgi:hydroxypyruvate reductase